MALHPDEEDITRMLAGDPKAFQRLVTQHIGSLTNYVGRFTGNRTDTEDIVQETFVRLWTRKASYDPSRSRLTTWLHRVAHNLCIDRIRQGERASIDTLDETEELATNQEPGSLLEQRTQQQQVESALLSLPAQQRGALVLFHYQGLSLNEVASTLDISTDAADSLLRRARASLRKKLMETE